MVKRIAAIVSIFIFLTGLAVPGYCGDPIKKLGRGLANMFTFPLEVPERIQKANVSDGPMAAITYGFLDGLVRMLARLSVGVYEVGTFIIPLPKDYKPIITDPEFFYEGASW